MLGTVLRGAVLAGAKVGSIRIRDSSGDDSGRVQRTTLIGADLKRTDLKGFDLTQCVTE